MSTMANNKPADFFTPPKSWIPLMLCVGQPPVWWDPHAPLSDLELGESACMDCPLAVQCRDEHARRKEFGLWGGMIINGDKQHDVRAWVKRRDRGTAKDSPRNRTCGRAACAKPFQIEGWDFGRRYCSPECKREVIRDRDRLRRAAQRREAASGSLAS
jgi:hypothetical protein